MARRGRRGRKGRHGKKAMPLAALLPLAPGITRILMYPQDLRHAVPDAVFYDTLAFDRVSGKLVPTVAVRQVGLAIGAVVGHKLANATGVNRMMKKLTFGWFQI